MSTKIRLAKNGCSSPVYFHGKAIYKKCELLAHHTLSDLGPPTDKNAWIEANLADPSKRADVERLLVDWELYENGWLVTGDSNTRLFLHKCQIGDHGYHKPDALVFLKH